MWCFGIFSNDSEMGRNFFCRAYIYRSCTVSAKRWQIFTFILTSQLIFSRMFTSISSYISIFFARVHIHTRKNLLRGNAHTWKRVASSFTYADIFYVRKNLKIPRAFFSRIQFFYHFPGVPCTFKKYKKYLNGGRLFYFNIFLSKYILFGYSFDNSGQIFSDRSFASASVAGENSGKVGHITGTIYQSCHGERQLESSVYIMS